MFTLETWEWRQSQRCRGCGLCRPTHWTTRTHEFVFLNVSSKDLWMPEAEGFPQRVQPNKLVVEVLRLDVKQRRTKEFKLLDETRQHSPHAAALRLPPSHPPEFSATMWCSQLRWSNHQHTDVIVPVIFHVCTEKHLRIKRFLDLQRCTFMPVTVLISRDFLIRTKQEHTITAAESVRWTATYLRI